MSAPQETLVFYAPVEFMDFAKHENPILRFYFKYAVNYLNEDNDKRTRPSQFFAEDCELIMPDGSKITGDENIMPAWRRVGGGFVRVDREILRMVLIRSPKSRSAELRLTLVMTLYKDLDEEPVRVPQAIIYQIVKAPEGEGTEGLQVSQIWHAYDQEAVDEARAEMEQLARSKR